jgi:hypothetical protein
MPVLSRVSRNGTAFFQFGITTHVARIYANGDHDARFQDIELRWGRNFRRDSVIGNNVGSPGREAISRIHDEALSGKWAGHRSSRLGLQYRIIYRLVSQEQLFQVFWITAHDYRRP